MARAGCSRQILRSSHSAGVTGLLPASQMHYSLRTHIITRAGLVATHEVVSGKNHSIFPPKMLISHQSGGEERGLGGQQPQQLTGSGLLADPSRAVALRQHDQVDVIE